MANNACFGQLRGSGKSNEITAIPQLLELLDIKGTTITMDAMGCQTKIAQQVFENEADCVVDLKGNQGNLHADVKLFLMGDIERAFKDKQHGYYQEVEGDHARIEARKVWVSNEVEWLRERHPEWSTINSIAVVQSIRDVKGKEKSEEFRFYISSKNSLDAQKMANTIRGHWAVENKLHWQLDVSFDEDACRLRSGHVAQNLSLFSKVALNLLKNETCIKKSIKIKRKKAGWDDAYLQNVLSVGKLIV